MRFKFFVTTFSLFLLFISTPGKAQKQLDENTDILEYLSISNSFLYNNSPSSNLDLIRRNSNVPEFGPVDEIWDKTPWLNPEINFRPSSSFISIGDINGDGIDDLAKRFLSVADERDSDISSLVNKSMIFYGGSNLSVEYDNLLYSYIYPVGDINGDGYSDAIGAGINNETTFLQGSVSGLTEANSSIADTLYSYTQGSYRFVIGEHLNDDEIEDIYGFYRDSETGIYRYFEIYGSSSFNELTIKEMAFPDGTSLYTNFWFRFSVNDTTLVGVVERNRQTSDNAFMFYKPSDNDNLIVADSIYFEITGNFLPLISDFDGDNVDDFIYLTSDENSNNYFYRGSGNSESVFDNPIPFTNNLISYYSSSPFLGGPILLGNVTGDTRTEILTSENNVVNIINFDTSQGRFVLTKSMHSSNFLFNSEILELRESIYKHHNSHFQGFNTFILPIQSDDKFGNIIFKTRDSFDSVEWEIFLENKTDFSRKIRSEVFHLSDLEDDGIDNFAVTEYNQDDTKIVIYNGFSDASPKSIGIENPDEMFVGHIESGFFDSETEKSLAILLRPYSNNEEQSEFRLYNQSDLKTPVFTFRQTDLDPSLNKLSLFSNLGDINNDGFDDLGFSAAGSFQPEKTFIFLGNSSLSQSPNITLDLNKDFPNPINGNTSLGATVIQGVGDLNDDGIDDFALGDGERRYTSELSQSNQFISGVIYILYGQDSAMPQFKGPDLELRADISNPENRQWFFGGLNNLTTGDFDGDGLKDLVSLSFYHSDSDNEEGVGALTYFFGEDGFTSEPDTTIPIRTEYIYNSDQNIEETYSKFSGRALIQTIPDLNGDNADELLYVGNRDTRKAVLYQIGNTPTEIATSIYTAPNKNEGLNPAGNFIDKQYLPLVGDYNGDGKPNFLGYQRSDGNYRDTPIYMYEISNIAVSAEEKFDDVPSKFSLYQNYPNPFNPSTNISFSIPKSGNVNIVVYNILGQEVSKIVNKKFTKGTHFITFDASSLVSGVYLYKITSGDFVAIKKMTLIK